MRQGRADGDRCGVNFFVCTFYIILIFESCKCVTHLEKNTVFFETKDCFALQIRQIAGPWTQTRKFSVSTLLTWLFQLFSSSEHDFLSCLGFFLNGMSHGGVLHLISKCSPPHTLMHSHCTPTSHLPTNHALTASVRAFTSQPPPELWPSCAHCFVRLVFHLDQAESKMLKAITLVCVQDTIKRKIT